MSMKKIRLVWLGITVSLLAACSTTPRTAAPVVDRTGSSTKPVVDASKPAATVAAARPDGKGYYTVKKGDTLYRIALESGQSYRDIVAWNNLTNPNDIKVDQVLRVAPPDGVQTGAVVAATSGIEVRPLGSSSTAGAGSAAVPTSASAAAGGNKIGPRGDKRAYSDSTLAELEKPDTAVTTAAAATPAPAAAGTTAAPAKAEPAHAVDKPAAAAAGEDEA